MGHKVTVVPNTFDHLEYILVLMYLNEDGEGTAIWERYDIVAWEVQDLDYFFSAYPIVPVEIDREHVVAEVIHDTRRDVWYFPTGFYSKSKKGFDNLVTESLPRVHKSLLAIRREEEMRSNKQDKENVGQS